MNKKLLCLIMLLLMEQSAILAAEAAPVVAKNENNGDCCPQPRPACCPIKKCFKRECCSRPCRKISCRPFVCLGRNYRSTCRPKPICCPRIRCCRPKPGCCPQPAPDCPELPCIQPNGVNGQQPLLPISAPPVARPVEPAKSFAEATPSFGPEEDQESQKQEVGSEFDSGVEDFQDPR
jgi:hypothetical protein